MLGRSTVRKLLVFSTLLQTLFHLRQDLQLDFDISCWELMLQGTINVSSLHLARQVVQNAPSVIFSEPKKCSLNCNIYPWQVNKNLLELFLRQFAAELSCEEAMHILSRFPSLCPFRHHLGDTQRQITLSSLLLFHHLHFLFPRPYVRSNLSLGVHAHEANSWQCCLSPLSFPPVQFCCRLTRCMNRCSLGSARTGMLRVLLRLQKFCDNRQVRMSFRHRPIGKYLRQQRGNTYLFVRALL